MFLTKLFRETPSISHALQKRCSQNPCFIKVNGIDTPLFHWLTHKAAVIYGGNRKCTAGMRCAPKPERDSGTLLKPRINPSIKSDRKEM